MRQRIESITLTNSYSMMLQMLRPNDTKERNRMSHLQDVVLHEIQTHVTNRLGERSVFEPIRAEDFDGLGTRVCGRLGGGLALAVGFLARHLARGDVVVDQDVVEVLPGEGVYRGRGIENGPVSSRFACRTSAETKN